jgi:hypothetical protein
LLAVVAREQFDALRPANYCFCVVFDRNVCDGGAATFGVERDLVPATWETGHCQHSEFVCFGFDLLHCLWCVARIA